MFSQSETLSIAHLLFLSAFKRKEVQFIDSLSFYTCIKASPIWECMEHPSRLSELSAKKQLLLAASSTYGRSLITGSKKSIVKDQVEFWSCDCIVKEKVWNGSGKVDHVACKYWCELQGSGIINMKRNLAQS